MILGWCTWRLASPPRAGIPCPGFCGAASDSPSVSDLVSGSSEGLVGAGVTGGTAGMAVGQCTTITPSSRIAEPLSAADLITADLIAATLITAILITATSTIATSTTTTSTTATPSTGLRVFTVSQEHTPARSVALITAEIPEAFPPVEGPASGEAATVAGDATGSRTNAPRPHNQIPNSTPTHPPHHT